LKNRVVLLDIGPIDNEIVILSQRSRHDETWWRFWLESKRFGMGMQKTCQNPLLQETFLGFLEEKKGQQIVNLENFIYLKFYLLNKLNKFVLVKFAQFFSVLEIIVLSKNSKFGENVEMSKLTILDLCRI